MLALRAEIADGKTDPDCSVNITNTEKTINCESQEILPPTALHRSQEIPAKVEKAAED